MAGRRSRRWTSVPKRSIGKQDSVWTLMPSATLAQRAASSSTTCRYTSYGCPPPPTSSPKGRPIRSASPRRRNTSRGKRSSRSYCAAFGASSASAISRVSAIRSSASRVGSSRSTGTALLVTWVPRDGTRGRSRAGSERRQPPPQPSGAGPADPDLAAVRPVGVPHGGTGIAGDGEPALVTAGVVALAEEGRVVETRGTAVGPVPGMMDVAPGGRCGAAGEDAVPVPLLGRPADRGRGGSLLTADVHGEAVRSGDDPDDTCVAGQPAGGLGGDRSGEQQLAADHPDGGPFGTQRHEVDRHTYLRTLAPHLRQAAVVQRLSCELDEGIAHALTVAASVTGGGGARPCRLPRGG